MSGIFFGIPPKFWIPKMPTGKMNLALPYMYITLHDHNIIFENPTQICFLLNHVFYFKITSFCLFTSKEAKEDRITGNVHVFHWLFIRKYSFFRWNMNIASGFWKYEFCYIVSEIWNLDFLCWIWIVSCYDWL